MLNAFNNKVAQHLRMEGCAACNKGCACCFGKLGKVKIRFNHAVRCGSCLAVIRSHRRILAAGHAVNAVVVNNNGKVDIAAARMNEVVAADSGSVAVTGKNNNIQLGSASLTPVATGIARP